MTVDHMKIPRYEQYVNNKGLIQNATICADGSITPNRDAPMQGFS